MKQVINKKLKAYKNKKMSKKIILFKSQHKKWIVPKNKKLSSWLKLMPKKIQHIFDFKKCLAN